MLEKQEENLSQPINDYEIEIKQKDTIDEIEDNIKKIYEYLYPD